MTNRLAQNNRPFTLPEKSSIFGVRLSPLGSCDLIDAIAEATGESRTSVIFSMRDNAACDLAEQRGVNRYDIPWDDGLIHLARELEIDVFQFEHDKPFRSLIPFVEHLKRTVPTFRMEKSKLKSSLAETRVRRIWDSWRNTECERLDCPFESHGSCDAEYGSIDFKAIYKALADHNEDRVRMLRDIDAKPSKKASRIANDSLARIAVASRD